jgi:hypothetical protein
MSPFVRSALAAAILNVAALAGWAGLTRVVRGHEYRGLPAGGVRLFASHHAVWLEWSDGPLGGGLVALGSEPNPVFNVDWLCNGQASVVTASVPTAVPVLLVTLISWRVLLLGWRRESRAHCHDVVVLSEAANSAKPLATTSV